MAFAVLSCSQLIHAFNVRSEKSLFEIGIFGNLKMLYSFLVCLALQVSVISIPALSAVFKTVPLNMVQWLVVAGLALSPCLSWKSKRRGTTGRPKKAFECSPDRFSVLWPRSRSHSLGFQIYLSYYFYCFIHFIAIGGKRGSRGPLRQYAK